jgi:hypothetical protein
MPDPDDDALPRARRRPGDAPRTDQPREARRSHRAHGGWAVRGVSLLQGAPTGQSRCPHEGATAQCSQGRAERSVPVRLGEEVQAVLRRATVAVTSKKSHTKLGSLMLYRILHWLPVLPGSLTIVPSTIRIVRLKESARRYTTFSRSNLIHNKRSQSSLLRRRLSKATSEMSAQCASLARTTVSRNE